MILHRKYTALCCLLAFGLIGAEKGIAAEWAAPTLGGSVGYNYRSLVGDGGADSVSQQLLGGLHVSSYLWRPWVGTANFSMTAALNDTASESEQGGNLETSSNILTGSLDLNVLPQSRAPLNLRYSVTDTRVDSSASSTDAFIVLSDGDATSERLGVTQVYTWEAGHRLRLAYDRNEWNSDRNGDYVDETTGLEFDMRGARYHMIANAKSQEGSRSVGALVNETSAFDVTHYFYPTKSFRLDSRASVYNTDRGFEVPSAHDQSGSSSSEIVQMSSFGFWRPAGTPWSLSGGLRVFDMAGENDGDAPQTNESKSINATLGGFYQYNKRWRWDFSVAHMASTSNEIDSTVNRGRLGMLLQSDQSIIQQFTHQWYVNASFDAVAQDAGGVAETRYNGNAALGHSAYRSWFWENGLSLRTSGAQVLTSSFSQLTTDSVLAEDETLSSQRLEHTFTTTVNRNDTAGKSYAQLTMSDGRSFGDSEMDQQMVWLQLNRDQQISRKSTLTGNLSLQYVRNNYSSSVGSTEVTTSTARASYRDIALFGVPRLGFLSDFLLSRASEERGVDRQEWENRLDYTIGQLVTSLSHRMIEYDDKGYAITFFRIERHF